MVTVPISKLLAGPISPFSSTKSKIASLDVPTFVTLGVLPEVTLPIVIVPESPFGPIIEVS